MRRLLKILDNKKASTSLPLDSVSNLLVAYSMRKLLTSYSGASIRVRRSSDSTELDIGFVNNVIDTASLLAFVGAGTGYVSKIYDQTGNGKTFTQASASAQPLIVNAGTLITKNSLPVVDFNTSSKVMNTSSAVVATQPFSYGVVLSLEAFTAFNALINWTNGMLFSDVAAYDAYFGNNLLSNLPPVSGRVSALMFEVNGASSYAMSATTAVRSGNAGTNNQNNFIQLTQNTQRNNFFEMFVISGINTANRSLLTNQNTYYGAY